MVYWETVSPLLKSILNDLMNDTLFFPFRLVGGTALSLQLGHRMSVDIDLFTDNEYDSLDFELIQKHLIQKYPYCEFSNIGKVGLGTYFKIGHSKEECTKLDLYYTDPFVFERIEIDNLRMASIEELIAMKLDVVNRGGRKKDFWDLHLFLDKFSFIEMTQFYKKRYPYHDSDTIQEQLVNFALADDDFTPICLLGKEWELIKLDFFERFGKM